MRLAWGGAPLGSHSLGRVLFMSVECPVCVNGGLCNSETRTCDCPSGFEGPACRKGLELLVGTVVQFI